MSCMHTSFGHCIQHWKAKIVRCCSMDREHIPIDFEESSERVALEKQLNKLTDVEMSFQWGRIAENVHKDGITLVFVAASVIAVLMDPFFFYIPLVDVKNKCVRTDKRLQIVALISRSVADILFLWDMIYQFRKPSKQREEGGESRPKADKAKPKKIPKKFRHITVDFFAILPIPQLLVVAFLTSGAAHPFGFSKNRFGRYLLLLLQYVPRTYIIIGMLGKLKENSPMWFISALYIFTSIIASHIIGAFWYFTAIQRQLTCWYQTSCSNSSGGECRIIYCNGDRHVYSNGTQTMINKTCSLDGGSFNYGMFSTALKSSYMERDVSGGKLSYFMWWGLKNLSSNGTDIETSNYMWENCFAIFVAVLGIVLFAYLIGHMQQFLQLMAEKKVVNDKVRKKKQEWKKREHVVPKKSWKQVWPWMQYKLEKENDPNMEFLDCLPEFIQNFLREQMLKKVLEPERFEKMKLVENKDKAWLENNIYTYLKPVIYTQKEFIFRVGEPLDSMLYIVDGTVIIYSTSSNSSDSPSIQEVLKGDDVYGDKQLMLWDRNTSTDRCIKYSLKKLPPSTKNVRCHTKVEGFVLTAEDLKTVLLELEKYQKKKEKQEERSHTEGTSSNRCTTA